MLTQQREEFFNVLAIKKPAALERIENALKSDGPIRIPALGGRPRTIPADKQLTDESMNLCSQLNAGSLSKARDDFCA